MRQVLVYLKNQYNSNLIPFARLLGLVLGVSLLAGFLVDIYAPFTGIWNVLRSVILIPLASSLFAAGYLVGYYLHMKRREEDPAWVPYRLRFSLNWRRRIALVVATLLFVLMYATMLEPTVGYTLVSSAFVAMAFALLTFIRRTREEAMREDLDIPDPRDVRYSLEMRRRAEKRRSTEEAKTQARRDKFNRVFKKEGAQDDA